MPEEGAESGNSPEEVCDNQPEGPFQVGLEVRTHSEVRAQAKPRDKE